MLIHFFQTSFLRSPSFACGLLGEFSVDPVPVSCVCSTDRARVSAGVSAPISHFGSRSAPFLALNSQFRALIPPKCRRSAASILLLDHRFVRQLLSLQIAVSSDLISYCDEEINV